jgi:hypothetical protein
MMVTAALNIYMDYEVIYHFVVASFAVAGWYDPEQNDFYSYFNWLVESVLYWSVGTHLVTYAMLLNSLLPLIGPVFNALIVALSYFIFGSELTVLRLQAITGFGLTTSGTTTRMESVNKKTRVFLWSR